MATWLTAELVGDGSPSGGSGFGKRTRVTSGVNRPSLEVMMSRAQSMERRRATIDEDRHLYNTDVLL
jgi:hypothetical protein